MNLLTQLVGMVVGFVTVMLAASLIVSVLVRVVHYLGDRRSKTLGEMLGGLNLAFRVDHGDYARAGDAAQTTFVLDILTYPALHLSSEQSATTNTAHPLDAQAQRQALATRVEYLTEENLIEIVKRLSENEPRAAQAPVEVPARWYVLLAPENRTLAELETYIRTWYKTVERVGTQSFVLASRRLTAVLSCIVVVFLCLDGIQLGVDLFHASSSLTDHLADQGQALLHSPIQAEATHPTGEGDAIRADNLTNLEPALTQAGGVLSEPGLNLGWQNSWMVKEIGDHRRDHPGARSGWMLFVDLIRWLVGLVVSCLLVSLGAPFWADQLTALLNLRNATAPPKPSKKQAPAT
jgi:hypothetical protein